MGSAKAISTKANLSKEAYDKSFINSTYNIDIEDMTTDVTQNAQKIKDKLINYYKEFGYEDSLIENYIKTYEESINAAAEAGADYALQVE
jgi:hypothetical protein